MTQIKLGGLVAAATLVVAISFPSHSAEWFDGRVKVDLNMLQGFQALDADSDVFFAGDDDPDSGFLRTRFNMSLTIEFTDWITGFIDLAEEPNDFGQNGFAITDDLSFMDFSLLDAFDSPLAENNTLILRVGEPVAVLFQYRGYSDGAQTHGNPLIANSPYDMVTPDTGAELLGHHEFGTAYFSALDWDLTVGTPNFFEDFADERGYHVTAKASIDILPADSEYGALSIGGGWSYNDASDQLFSNGGPQPLPSGATAMVGGDGENIRFPSAGIGGVRNTHAGLLPGIELNLYQINVMYKPNFVPLRLIGFYGGGEDEFSFVDAAGAQTVLSQSGGMVNSIRSEVAAWGIEATYDIIPDLLYVAGRFTQVSNESDGIAVTGSMERFQIGGGVWIADNVLLKVEYINQSEEAGSPGQIGDDWQGGLVEVSAAF